MEMIRRPLSMTESENRKELNAIKEIRDGWSEGNRHERRLAQKRERQQRKRQLASNAT